MKNIVYLVFLFILLSCMILYSATQDRRTLEPDNHPVFRIELSQLTRDDGDANDVNTTVNLNGTIRQITVGVNDNTGNKTVTIDIIDDNGSVLFTTETIAENTTSAPVVQHFMTESGTDLPLAILVTGTVTINANLSGDPGSGGMTIDVVIYGD